MYIKNGYYINQVSGSGGNGGSGDCPTNTTIDEDGNIIFEILMDNIYIEEDKVFYSEEERNGALTLLDGRVYAIQIAESMEE